MILQKKAILLAKTYHDKLTTNPNERSHLYQGPYAEISLVAWSRKSFYLLIVALEVAWTLAVFRVVFRDRANIYTNSSETT